MLTRQCRAWQGLQVISSSLLLIRYSTLGPVSEVTFVETHGFAMASAVGEAFDLLKDLRFVPLMLGH